MAARNPARVLPEPVGAQTSVCRPAMIAGQLPAWASVGPSANRRSNHVRTAGWKPSRASARPETAGADAGELTVQVHHDSPRARARVAGAGAQDESGSTPYLGLGDERRGGCEPAFGCGARGSAVWSPTLSGARVALPGGRPRGDA